MRLGFAAKVMGEEGLPSNDTRRWQSGPHLRHSIAYILNNPDGRTRPEPAGSA